MTMRVALYARYSSDLQRDASIEDQLRICRAHADREGWTIAATFADSVRCRIELQLSRLSYIVVGNCHGRRIWRS